MGLRGGSAQRPALVSQGPVGRADCRSSMAGGAQAGAAASADGTHPRTLGTANARAPHPSGGGRCLGLRRRVSPRADRRTHAPHADQHVHLEAVAACPSPDVQTRRPTRLARAAPSAETAPRNLTVAGRGPKPLSRYRLARQAARTIGARATRMAAGGFVHAPRPRQRAESPGDSGPRARSLFPPVGAKPSTQRSLPDRSTWRQGCHGRSPAAPIAVAMSPDDEARAPKGRSG